MSGCATAKVSPKAEPIFYPPSPEEPRVQYLTSISSSQDVEGDPGAFAKFIVGDEPLKVITKPYGITLHQNKLYVCDTVINTLEIIDLQAKTFEYFQPEKAGQLVDPINVDVASDGTMYVADARRGQVLVFDAAGKFKAAIGEKGELKPTDIALSKDRILICDLKSKAVRVYAAQDRGFLYAIPKAEDEDQTRGMFSPTNIDMDADGNIYVTDTGAFNVKKYSPEGALLQTFGLQGDTPGSFARPKGVAVDKEGRIYVVDAAFENVQMFGPDGKLLMFFPEQRDEARLTLPAGILIDYDHLSYFQEYVDESFELEYLIFVSSQYGDRKISVFGFGRRK